tara:strand:+ start:252 stop:941 length:690 start_codon:yes stop_codon:yes gene_type:complete
MELNKNLKLVMGVFMLLLLPILSHAQKDVTQFLDIPVDGYKPDMIEKLKSKGYTFLNKEESDVLEGEFNGQDVYISIGTNNNKVYRIGLVDKQSTNETNIKIRFNNLIQQFSENSRYLSTSDSMIAKIIIPEDEDISYKMMVENKRYEATFYQKTLTLDSLNNEMEIQMAKEPNEYDYEKVNELILEVVEEKFKSLEKTVWFMIAEEYGKYQIYMFYENSYNKADGSQL